MHRSAILSAAVLSLGIAASAHATNYNVDLTTLPQTVFSGSFAAGTPVDDTITIIAPLPLITATFNVGGAGWASNVPFTVTLWDQQGALAATELFTHNGTAAFTSAPINFSLTGGYEGLRIVGQTQPGGGSASRSYTVEFTAAVPEAHEWALMLGGLGLVGWLARRRQSAAPARLAAA